MLSGGVDWGNAVDPFLEMEWIFPAGVMLYITFGIFGFLNVLTSVFVDTALRGVEKDKELVVEREEKQRKIARGHLEKLFRELDLSGDGFLCREEMDMIIGNSEIYDYLAALDLGVSDA